MTGCQSRERWAQGRATKRRCNMKRALMLALAMAAMGGGLLPARVRGGEPAALPWRGWDSYQVIMWSTGSPRDLATWFGRLKEMGCTAEETGRGTDPSVFARNGFGFYV